VGLALKCTRCDAVSVSAMFYRGSDAHICRICRAPLELADPARDRRRAGADRRAAVRPKPVEDWAEWRSGEERRRGWSTPGTLSRTAA
jgi:hypothetical protein